MSLTVGSLFSGIGGLDLGLERAGMTVRWNSEIDPYCCRVLSKHWPDVPNHGDITTIDWSTVEPVDVICGGYPCQPFSLAGVRRGEDDPRHLWPHFADALRLLRPRFALLENVPGHLSLGFGRVLGDLAELGYDADWDCIPAAAVGAPHLRYRVFIVAHAQRVELREQPVAIARGERPAVVGDDGSARTLADPDSRGLAWHAQTERRGREVHPDEQRLTDTQRRGTTVADPDGLAGSTTGPREQQAGSAGGQDAITRTVGRRSSRPREAWAPEPDVGRVADGVPARVDRLRALGNAVVPQVAEFIGRQLIDQLERAA